MTRRTLPAAMALVLVTAMGVEPAAAQDVQDDGVSAVAGGNVVPFDLRVIPIELRVVPYDGRVTSVEGSLATVALDADVLFEFDRADLTPGAEQTLAQVVTELDDRAQGSVLVVGHTDAIGDDAYNLDLSRRRAQTVTDFLAAQVSQSLDFAAEGRGEAEPVADNVAPDGSDDPEGRRRNRRVEVTFEVTAEEPEAPDA